MCLSFGEGGMQWSIPFIWKFWKRITASRFWHAQMKLRLHVYYTGVLEEHRQDMQEKMVLEKNTVLWYFGVCLCCS
jgi:hypothetical protein